ncbi:MULTISPECIES: bifunctional nicotinamidase/pyrazinamidase [Legionella]|uniref:nicotinamidase n=1 Tax=Legionella drozanskii LLAP-1 TaxID=1212489 RepID=A0A0W0T8E2_9GAMM|nr:MULTISPECIES: bifunctional nicotinamidase/pyrazinamidase [Legionella]KTC91792.1 bifunctional pyrazinamidase/nicotinamidase [Legionella drozanskii LLAP-1]PJE17993.1 MAG: nicotinamidase/pyrazinamidase [Legionella sp.]
MKTLIIIDAQNDFMPGGSLEVAQGDLIVPIINKLQPQFDLIVATQDWHPAEHKSFASNQVGKKLFEKIELHGIEQTLWPDHCVQGTIGAELHPQLETRSIEAIFRKGMQPENDSYSGFYDNNRQSTGLAGFLREKGAQELYFCGLCADICVYYTIKDAIAEGFKSCLIEDATRALDKENFQRIKEELLLNGVKILRSIEL